VLIGKGDNILPLTYVQNTVEALYLASVVERAIGQSYNIIDDGEITARAYLEQFRQITGTNARLVSVPYCLPYLATAAYEVGVGAGFLPKGVTSRAQLRWKQASVRFDNTKAKIELGWQPTIPLEEGITRTFRWYADHDGEIPKAS
jgi:nucleoside-diphosphate-sugar epimerase